MGGRPNPKYLQFMELPNPGRTTRRVAIVATKNRSLLGEIRWFGRWRQYGFFPLTDVETVFNTDCLDAITAEIRAMMRERNTKRQPAQNGA